jgi:TctA family transporter
VTEPISLVLLLGALATLMVPVVLALRKSRARGIAP